MSGDGGRAYVERSAAISALLVLIALLGCAGMGALGGYDYELQKGFEAEEEDDFARALDHYEAAADLAREREMPSHSLAMALADVARSALYLGDLERAGEAAQRAIEIYASDPPQVDTDPYQPSALATLGRVHIERREFSKAAELFEQSLRLDDDNYLVRNELVWAYWELGDVDRAIVELTRVLEYMETYAFTGFADPAFAHNDLGFIHYYRGNYDACALEQQTALAQARDRYEPDDPVPTSCLTSLASCLLELGRYDEAEALLEEALSILENPEVPKDRARLRTKALADLALLRTRQGRVEEARKALEEARIAQEKWFATEPSGRVFQEEIWREDSAARLARVEANLAAAEGRPDAIALYETSLQRYEERFGANSPHLRVILEDYLGALHAAGEERRAAEVERRLAAISAQLDGGEAP